MNREIFIKIMELIFYSKNKIMATLFQAFQKDVENILKETKDQMLRAVGVIRLVICLDISSQTYLPTLSL